MQDQSRLNRLKALQAAADILAQAQVADVLGQVQFALDLERQRQSPPDRRDEPERTRYFRSVFTVEVLSEGEPIDSALSLTEIDAAITYGDCTGLVHFEGCRELDAQQMREAVEAVGSDPSIFQSLVEDEDEEQAAALPCPDRAGG
ncbi:MAG TPA: hypothetical protein VN259_07545 [Xanthomonadales bacterium]|nr:hypothetical protein [Xanthomonadales bacterium]